MNLKIGNLSLSDGVSAWLMGFDPGSEPKTTEEVGLRADIMFVGSREVIEAVVSGINRNLEKARRSQDDYSVEKVYIEADTGSGWVRSEIIEGVLDVKTDYYDRLNRNNVKASLLLTRKNWWEGPETALPIGNINNGVVFNCNDGSGTSPNVRTNAATITANLIEGDLPTPARLEIENQYNKTIGSLWVGMNKTRPNWLSGWMLEAENAIGVTPVSAAGASGGAVAQGQLSYGSAQPILRWALDEALITMMRGQRLRLLLRPYYLGAYSVFKHKLKITSGVTPVYETDWIRPSAYYARHWLDMFDVRMPPWLEGKTDLAGLTLELWATPTRAGTWTWAFDDLMLFAQDGFVTLDTFTEPGGKVVIDGDQGWSEDAAGKKSGLRKFVGSLELTPMAFHLFYFAFHSSTMNDAPTDFAALVRGFYRPRRLTL